MCISVRTCLSFCSKYLIINTGKQYFCYRRFDIIVFGIIITDIILLCSAVINCYYTVNHKKGGRTFVIITLENLDGFFIIFALFARGIWIISETVESWDRGPP